MRSLENQIYHNNSGFYLISDNVDTNAPHEELPSLNLSSSNLLDSTNTNSLPSKVTFNNDRNVQPDILTHGNHTPNSKFNHSQENILRTQSSIADKKSISSLYVDMIPDNFTHNNFNHFDSFSLHISNGETSPLQKLASYRIHGPKVLPTKSSRCGAC